MAEDVEFFIESFLSSFIIESSDKDGAVRVAINLLVQMWMPYTNMVLVKHKT